jgi:hypothetical protein
MRVKRAKKQNRKSAIEFANFAAKPAIPGL